MSIETIRARWAAAHDDETLVRSLSEDEARACLYDAIADIHALITEIDRRRGTQPAPEPTR